MADCNLHHDGFAAGYFWGDNGVNFGGPQVTIDCHGAVNQNGYAGSLNEHIQSSRYLGWSASCGAASCTPTGAGVIVFSVLAITLEAQETSGPGLTADQSSNLYYQSGWVRGAFPADLSASDPSGVCLMQTTVNGRAISTYVDPSPDQHAVDAVPRQRDRRQRRHHRLRQRRGDDHAGLRRCQRGRRAEHGHQVDQR